MTPGPSLASWRPGATALLRAVVLGTSTSILWWPVTLRSGALLAGVVACLAALAADAAARPGRGPALRLLPVALIALAVAAVGGALARLLVRVSGVAELLGPVGTLQLSEIGLCVAVTAPAVFALRLAAARRPLLSLLEVAVVASAFLAGFSAHREGMVHRPLALGDFAWSRGLDPTVLFLCLGGLCLLLLATLLLAEERVRRIPLHLGALLAVALLLAVFVRLSGLPQPRPPGDLGLTGSGSGESEETASGGRSGHQLESLDFKDEYQKNGGQAPVAVVLLHDDYSPPTGTYYFRQSVFSEFNGRRLVRTTRPDVDLDIVERFPTRRLELPWQALSTSERMPLLTTTGLLVDHVRPFALDSPIELSPAQNRDGLRFQRTYEAQSMVPILQYDALLGSPPGDEEWNAAQWRHYTEAPADPRYAELAQESLEVLLPEYREDALARALAVKLYLDGNGIYSRRSQHSTAEDPTASFLFGDLTGYCVHFAHAAVYLMRALGLPARVASGYAVPESDRGSGSAIMIRGLNAHAWPEVYLAGVGWVVVDPVPERNLEEAAPRPDDTLQSMLGEMLRRGVRGQPPWEDAASDPIGLADVGRGLGLLVALAIALGFAVKAWRGLAPRLAAAAQGHRLSYRAALDRLAELGRSRRYGETREHFAERVGPLAPSFAALTALHLHCALGGAASPPAGEMQGLRMRLHRELRAQVPLWRRALGWIDPFAWLRSR